MLLEAAETVLSIFGFNRAAYAEAPKKYKKWWQRLNEERQKLSGVFKGFPDFTVEIVMTHHSDDAVILEIRMKGTHEGEWAGIKPTGKTMNITAACIFDFDQDRLIGEKVYFDMATLARQLS